LPTRPKRGKLCNDVGKTTREENQLRRIALFGLIALAMVVAAVTPASTALGAPRAVPLADALYGVSCVSAKSCLAVGQDRNVARPIAQTWNGTAWQTVTVKLPTAATGGSFGHVTCTSATHCLAAGFYRNSGGTQFPLADIWNGKTWAPIALPGPVGVATDAHGVSCVSASSCVVVGAYSSGGFGHALADIWNGRTWRQTRPPAPRGAVISTLSAVSCRSATFCVADGLYFTNAGGGVLIESWNGKTWSRMAGVVPRGTKDGYLNAVSCVSVQACFAVGAAATAKGLGSVAESWNGKHWALTPVPWPRGTTNPALTGVSCVAANRCVAVGISGTNTMGIGATGRAAAFTWNGKAWAATAVAPPASGNASSFNVVTCRTATFCVAVGQVGPVNSIDGTGLSGFWNAARWRLVTAK